MAESGWKRIISDAELPDGKPVVATLDGEELLLFKRGATLFACGNKCSHYGGPLAEGLVVGDAVICPWHNARFDMASGRKEAPPGLGPVAAYEVKNEKGDIYVREASKTAPPNRGGGKSVLILGGGAAADTAAETLRNEGFQGAITMVTREADLPYDRTVLSKGFLTGETKPEWVPLREEGFYDTRSITVLRERTIVRFDPKKREAALDNGEKLRGDMVLLATGSTPRRLPIPGSDLPGCFYLRSLADGRRLLDAVTRSRSAVVIGASFIGLETASALRERKVETHVVAPERHPLANVFGEKVAARIRGIHEEHGVRFHLEMTVRAIEGKGKVERVTLADGSVIEADLIIIGAGVVPAVEYLAGSDIVAAGAVPVNERLETKYPGVYAAGDIAVVPDAQNGGTARIEHWVVAQRHGYHAAKAMLGSKEPYAEPPFFWTMQYGNSIKYTGRAQSFDEVVFRGSVDSGPFAAGYCTSGSVTAVSTIGKGRDLLIAGELLKEGVRLSSAQFRDVSDLEALLPGR